MLDSSENATALVDVGSWHLETVALQTPDAVTIQDSGDQTSQPDSRAEQFREGSQVEPELSVQSAGRVGNSRNVTEAILLKKLRVAIVVAHVHEHDSTAGRFDCRPLL